MRSTQQGAPLGCVGGFGIVTPRWWIVSMVDRRNDDYDGAGGGNSSVGAGVVPVVKRLGPLVRLSRVEGDEDLTEFCRSEWPRLVGSMSLYLGRRDLAEDLAQEALIRVCARWDEVREASSPSAWAHRVAFNLAKSHGRREAAWARLRVRAVPRADGVPVSDSADAIAVRAAVASLPTAQREAVILRYFADLPIRHVAAVMECPENTVKTHVRRACARLRVSGLLDADDPDDVEDVDDVEEEVG
jgi:RNA polymerase sigma-70 factor (ECF subfamily)